MMLFYQNKSSGLTFEKKVQLPDVFFLEPPTANQVETCHKKQDLPGFGKPGNH